MAFFEQPYWLLAFLFALSLLPLLVVMGTTFLKLAVVLSLLRNALGIQQIPPNMAIYGLSLLLTTFIMAPVGLEIRDNIMASPLKLDSPELVQRVEHQLLLPYRNFLMRNTDKLQVEFFSEIGLQIWPEKYCKAIPPDSILVLMPAFTVSQLIEAFKIGLLLYLPFIAIDLIVSNILLAMGMMMVSPMTIALPFKLLIFVLVGGWQKLIDRLILSFA